MILKWETLVLFKHVLITFRCFKRETGIDQEEKQKRNGCYGEENGEVAPDVMKISNCSNVRDRRWLLVKTFVKFISFLCNYRQEIQQQLV